MIGPKDRSRFAARATRDQIEAERQRAHRHLDRAQRYAVWLDTLIAQRDAEVADRPAPAEPDSWAALRSSVETMRAANRAANPPVGSAETTNVGYTSGFDFAMQLVLDEMTTIEQAPLTQAPITLPGPGEVLVCGGGVPVWKVEHQERERIGYHGRDNLVRCEHSGAWSVQLASLYCSVGIEVIAVTNEGGIPGHPARRRLTHRDGSECEHPGMPVMTVQPGIYADAPHDHAPADEATVYSQLAIRAPDSDLIMAGYPAHSICGRCAAAIVRAEPRAPWTKVENKS